MTLREKRKEDLMPSLGQAKKGRATPMTLRGKEKLI